MALTTSSSVEELLEEYLKGIRSKYGRLVRFGMSRLMAAMQGMNCEYAPEIFGMGGVGESLDEIFRTHHRTHFERWMALQGPDQMEDLRVFFEIMSPALPFPKQLSMWSKGGVSEEFIVPDGIDDVERRIYATNLKLLLAILKKPIPRGRPQK